LKQQIIAKQAHESFGKLNSWAAKGSCQIKAVKISPLSSFAALKNHIGFCL